MVLEKIDREKLDCLVEFMLRNLLLEALYALRGMLYMLKYTLEGYIALYIVDPMDKLIEKTMMDLRFSNAFVNEATKLLDTMNEIRSLLPIDVLKECAGFVEVDSRISEVMDVVLAATSVGGTYLTKHGIVTKIEEYRDKRIREALGAIDVLIVAVEDAIDTYGE